MQVLLINGSPNSDGNTYKALQAVEESLHSRGIETKWFQLGRESVRGCIGCHGCKNSNRCVFSDDKCNELIELLLGTDGVIIGTPVYFAGPNGALCALLDRVFYATSFFGKKLKGKPAAAVVSVWKTGATAALDRLNKYFTYSGMPVISGDFWNISYEPDNNYDTMKQLGINMADVLMKRG